MSGTTRVPATLPSFRLSRVGFTTALFLYASSASPELIVKQGLSRATVEIVSALLDAAPSKTDAPKVVNLSGDFGTDLDRVTRAAAGDPVLFAVGPNAAVLAGSVVQSRKDARLVALGVPNPERLDAPAQFVSFYPPLDTVLRFLKSQFGAASVGLVYSPNQNSGIAEAFAAAAPSSGVTVKPIPASSPGELVRHLKGALAAIDVLLVPVDPLIFDPESFKILADEARAAKKPSIGFLEELPRRGLTGALMTSRAALARTAWEVSRNPGAHAKVIEVEGSLLYVTQDGTTVVDVSHGESSDAKPKK